MFNVAEGFTAVCSWYLTTQEQAMNTFCEHHQNSCSARRGVCSWPGSLGPAAVRQRGVWHKGPSACCRAGRTSEHGRQVSCVPNRAGATLPRQASERAWPGTCLEIARQALERERGTCAVWASATLCHPDLMLRR